MLANIVRHYVLDTWFETTVKSHVKGFCEIVRYADDFVCVVRYLNQAKRIERGLQNRLNEYDLEVHPTKIRHISWDRFTKYLEHYPLSKPKIVHSFYVVSVR